MPGFTNETIARTLRNVVGERPTTLTHLPISWEGDWWTFRHPLDFLGSDGGGGVGGGPGISVGAALALKGSGRLAVAICGDGDYLMGVTALWTAVHYKIPLLFVIANNRSFYNDELHQERMARMRSRPVENKWIGQQMPDPEIDLAAMARAQGAAGFGPMTNTAELAAALEKAIAAVDAGEVAVVDVRVEPGYSAGMTAAMTRSQKLNDEEATMNTAVPLKSIKAGEAQSARASRRVLRRAMASSRNQAAMRIRSIPAPVSRSGRSPIAAQPTLTPPWPRRRRPSTAGATPRHWNARGCSSASPTCCASMPMNWR